MSTSWPLVNVLDGQDMQGRKTSSWRFNWDPDRKHRSSRIIGGWAWGSTHSGKKVLSRKPIKGCLVDDDDDVYMSAKSDKYLTVVSFVFVMDTYCVFCEAGTGF